MSKKPTVAIVDGSFIHSVVRMFKNYGFQPVNTVSLADILVLTGGADIHPSLYNQQVLQSAYYGDRDRDSAELKLYEIAGNRPKIGICRGAQFLNAVNGGSMWQNVNNHGGSSHTVYNRRSKSRWGVTSIHHQMMIPGVDGELVLAANEATKFSGFKEDMLIEGDPQRDPEEWVDAELIYYKKDKAFCYQAHPEQGTKTEQFMFFHLIRELMDLEGVPTEDQFKLDGPSDSAEYSESDISC